MLLLLKGSRNIQALALIRAVLFVIVYLLQGGKSFFKKFYVACGGMIS